MAVKCPNCAYDNADGALCCNLCQTVLKREPAKPPEQAPPPAANSKQDKEAEFKALIERGTNAALSPGGIDEAIACFEKALALLPSPAVTEQDEARRERLVGFIEAQRRRKSEGQRPASATTAAPAAAPGSSTVHKEGDLIGQKYQIAGVLGRGGFGIVYKALQLDTMNVCALKTFLDEYLGDQQTRAQFRKEAQVWVDLDRHPYLVRALMVDEITGRLYLVMEMVAPGRSGLNSLDAFLRRQPPALAQSLKWAIQFCHGMEYAASKGVRCHRDIKPANILISGDATVKISDFGLAAALGASKALAGRVSRNAGGVGLSAVSGGGFGTPTHMPPEQFTNAAACDQKSDVYSFGAVLFQMAAKGRLPFLAPVPRDGSAAESSRFWNAMHQLHAQAPVPPLDSPLAPVIARCLQKTPAARYQSFAELRAELEILLKAATGETVVPPTVKEFDAAQWNDKGLSLANLKRYDEALRCFDKGLEISPHDEYLWTHKGCALMDLKRSGEALACFDKALALNPKHASAMTDKGLQLMELGRHEEALMCFMQAAAISPLNAVTAVAEGTCYDNLGRYEDALRSYDWALELDADNSYAWNNKGNTLRHMGRLKEAVACFDKALILEPMLAPSWISLGECLGNLGEPGKALKAFDKALELEPEKAAVWADKGAALVDLVKPAEALACYDRAVALDPKLARAWNGRSTASTMTGELDEALKSAEQAVALDPAQAQFWFAKASSLYTLGRFADAVPCFAKTLELEPEYASALLFGGDNLRELKRFAEALPYLERAEKVLKPGTRTLGRALYYKGYCLHALGRREEAQVCYTKSLELYPGFPNALAAREACAKGLPPPEDAPDIPPEVRQAAAPKAELTPEAVKWNKTGIEYFKAKKPKEAAEAFKKAVELSPAFAGAWGNLGLVLSDLGSKEQALESYVKSCEADPRLKSSWLNRGAILTQLGRGAEAVPCFDKALELDPKDMLAWLNKATNLSDLGRGPEALACYEEMLKIDAKIPDVWNNKGCAELKMGRFVEALRSFEAVLALDANHAFGWDNKGEALNKLGRFKDALPCFSKALAIRSFGAPWGGRGDSYRNLEQYQEALAAYQKAIEIAPKFSSAWYGRAVCEDKMYLSDQAVESYKKFLALASAKEDGKEIESARRRLVELGVQV
ncbi:MAG: tetratricopeptide repeat protein [Elusimicrobia bacterium]|nr:tetratricopeptide repeat protein [Elusimicrobiota bacterium]